MSRHFSRAIMLAVPTLGLAALAQTADAATNRWQDVAYTPTFNDGLALTGASFEGYKIFDTLALPFFTFNGVRYELTEATRVSAPKFQETDGTVLIETTYRVPVQGGDVDIYVSHAFFDHDTRNPDLGEFSSRVSFEGPEGQYSFYWRIDPDLRGAAGDRVQVYHQVGPRGIWQASPYEETVALSGVLEFGRHKIRINDGPDYVHQTQLRLAAPEQGDATAFIVKATDGEWEINPEQLVNQDRIQSVQRAELVPQPIEGSDIVVWYRADMDAAAGEVGPSLYASTTNIRQAVIELDHMAPTELPPASMVHNGEVVSIESAFDKAGVTINRIFKDGSIPDVEKLAITELDAIMEGHADYQASQDTETQWYSWFGIARNLSIPGVLGIMYDCTPYSSDEAYREGAFGFYDAIQDTLPMLVDAGYPPQDPDFYLLWTVTHETGHAYNQHHEDWYYDDTSCFYENSAIMGYSYDANTLFWDFGPNSTASMRGGDPDEYVRPGHGVDMVNMDGIGFYPYNTTKAHKQGHNRTYQFRGGGCE